MPNLKERKKKNDEKKDTIFRNLIIRHLRLAKINEKLYNIFWVSPTFSAQRAVPSAIYGSSGDQSGKDKLTSQTRRAVPIVEVYHYSITNPMFLLLTVSLSCKYSSCKYNYFPHISWFVLSLLLLVFTNQNTTILNSDYSSLYQRFFFIPTFKDVYWPTIKY